MRILAFLCASLLVFGLAAFDISLPDRGGGLAAGMFAGAAVYDISSGFLAYFAPAGSPSHAPIGNCPRSRCSTSCSAGLW